MPLISFYDTNFRGMFEFILHHLLTAQLSDYCPLVVEAYFMVICWKIQTDERILFFHALTFVTVIVSAAAI